MLSKIMVGARIRSSSPWLVGLLLLGCGRTGIDLPLDEIADDGAEGNDGLDPSMDDGVSFLDPDEPNPRPPDLPLPESCGDGIIQPGELCFRPQVEFWSRLDPCALDVGDIDGDGNLDVVTPNSDFEHVESTQNLTSVLYGNGLGQLSEPVPYVSGDDIPVGVRLGDLDGSGELDVVVVNSDAGSLTVLLNLGEQQLGDAGRVSAGSLPIIADLGDLNGDGVLDVAVTATDEIRLAFGRGDGNFEASTTISRPGMLWATRLLDLDGNGTVDMVASNASEARVHVWLGDGHGQLSEAGSLDMPGLPLGIADADVDGDGRVDLLVAHSFGMAVLLGQGNGSFDYAADVEAGVSPRDVAVADYDHDGRLDVAIVNSSSQDVTLARGRGDGRFDYAATYAVGSLPSGIEAGDFNRDGIPDLAVSNQLSNTIGLILSDP